MGKIERWGAMLLLAALGMLFTATGNAGEKVYINGIDANFPPLCLRE